MHIRGVPELGELIGHLKENQALGLGSLRDGLPEEVKVVVKNKLEDADRSKTIARTQEDIVYRKGQPTVALIDADSKGITPEVAAKVEHLGGFWEAQQSVLPQLKGTARVMRRSTSSGLSRSDTGEKLPGSNNMHLFILVKDGTDIERFLTAFHDRCWLAGLGWWMVGAAGQLLERSIIDRSVGGPERLVFEGPPTLVKPIQQDRESRHPVAFDGSVLDTVKACPSLTIVEMAKVKELKAKEEERIAPEAARVRAAYIKRRVGELRTRNPDMSDRDAERIVASQCGGVLLPDVVLPFDDDELKDCTVGDVLANPQRFDGATLADPLEGVEYGRCKAMIMRRSDGTPWIHSFAHGRTFYQLKLDAAAVRSALEKVDKGAAVMLLIDLVAGADLRANEVDALGNFAAEHDKANKRTVASMLKAAAKERAKNKAAQEAKHRIAKRNDPRPAISVPYNDAPWLPVMDTVNQVLGTILAAIPPARDIDGSATDLRLLAHPGTHAFTPTEANPEEDDSNV
jgi:hypothetical protein